MQFNPVDQADNLRKYGGYIPGIRPGPPTAAYLDRVLQRLTLPGSLFLATVAVAPSLFIKYFGFSQATGRALGGTSVLIVVGVALDTMRQMESQMMMRHYEGFLQLNVLILGPQGAGKGTQAKRIAAEYGIPHIATGDLYRAAIAERLDRPRAARSSRCSPTASSSPTSITIALIRDELAEGAANGFVLDGFPRTTAAGRGARRAARRDRPAALVVFDCSRLDDARARRAADEARRATRVAPTTRRRRSTQRLASCTTSETEPVVEHYRTSGNLVQVHPRRAPDRRRRGRRSPTCSSKCEARA